MANATAAVAGLIAMSLSRESPTAARGVSARPVGDRKKRRRHEKF